MAEHTPKVRWQCPTGEHPGILGPRQPRRDSMVRYCVPCSVASGRLTERVAPALARARAIRDEQAKTKAKAKRARAAAERQRKAAADAARFTVDGVDLRDEMARLRKLRAFGGPKGKLATMGRLHLTVSRPTAYPRSRLGFAEPWTGRIHLALYRGISLREARQTLLHELAHHYVGGSRTSSGARSWHGPSFQRALREACAEAGQPVKGWAVAAGGSM